MQSIGTLIIKVLTELHATQSDLHICPISSKIENYFNRGLFMGCNPGLSAVDSEDIRSRPGTPNHSSILAEVGLNLPIIGADTIVVNRHCSMYSTVLKVLSMDDGIAGAKQGFERKLFERSKSGQGYRGLEAEWRWFSGSECWKGLLLPSFCCRASRERQAQRNRVTVVGWRWIPRQALRVPISASIETVGRVLRLAGIRDASK